MVQFFSKSKLGCLAVLLALLLPSSSLWAQDADLDPSFLTGSGFSGFSGSDVNAIAVQDDGKIIVGGSFGDYNGSFVGRIARLNPNGTLDASFNTGTGFSDQVKTVAIQADGKIIVGGDFFGFNGATYNRLVRLNANGSVDNTFAVSVEGGSVEDVEIQSDGKIVIGGSFTSISGQNARKIARLNSNGSLDSVFSGSSDFSFGVVRDLEIQSDGKIVACGTFSQLQGGTATNIARLNPTGTFDASFNTGTAFNSDVTSIALQSDGKIVVGGFFTQYNGSSLNRIARLNTNGSLDGTFTVGSGFNGLVSVVEIQSDGKILVGGLDFTTYNGNSAVRIARLSTNGALDSNFNSGSGFDISVFSIALQPDGKILVGGQFSSYNGQFKPSLVRLNGTSTVVDPSCNAGTIPSGTTALCASDFFTFDVVGADIPEGFSYGLLFEPGAGASGGFGGASYITEVPLSLSFNGDLNGLFSGNGLPPFSGPWSITGVVYSDPNDVAGTVCASSNSVVVNYLDCDCQGVEGGSAFVDGCGTCVAGTTGLEACDASCWSPTVEMQSPDNISYAYSNAAGWSVPVGYHADILAQAVVYVDGVDGSTFGCNAPSNDLTGKIALVERGGCAFSVKVYNAQQAGAVAVIVVNNVPGNEIFQMGGGDFAELISIPAVMIGNTDGTALIASAQNGPVELFIGNNCVPLPCEAGSLSSAAEAELCPADFYEFSVADVIVPEGANYALLFEPGTNGAGALDGAFFLTVPSLPYGFDADINGVLSANVLPPLSGEWIVSGLIYTDPNDPGNSICSNTPNSATINFLSEADAICQPDVLGCTDADAANYDPSATLDDGSCLYNVVFRVDMAQVTDPFTTPEVNGTFNGWCGGCAPMTNVGGSVWELTIALAPGTYEFKYAADSWNIAEQLTQGSPCTITSDGFTNRLLQVADQGIDLGTVCWASCNACENPPVEYDVVFRVDMSQVSDPFTTPEVNGIFNGWCGGCAPMTNVGNNVWEITISLAPGIYEYKFAADAWSIQEELTVGDFCTLTTGSFTNRLLEVVDANLVLETVCWGSCSACVLPESGCTYASASNYNPLAVEDDGSCVFAGCTDSQALNFTPLATFDDGSCEFDSGTSCASDITGDGVVNVSDLLSLLAAFGSNCE